MEGNGRENKKMVPTLTTLPYIYFFLILLFKKISSVKKKVSRIAPVSPNVMPSLSWKLIFECLM